MQVGPIVQTHDAVAQGDNGILFLDAWGKERQSVHALTGFQSSSCGSILNAWGKERQSVRAMTGFQSSSCGSILNAWGKERQSVHALTGLQSNCLNFVVQS